MYTLLQIFIQFDYPHSCSHPRPFVNALLLQVRLCVPSSTPALIIRNDLNGAALLTAAFEANKRAVIISAGGNPKALLNLTMVGEHFSNKYDPILEGVLRKCFD